MLSLVTRIFTTRVCPTCSKAVHRKKIETHLRRHSAGRTQFYRYTVHIDADSKPSVSVAVLFRRVKDGVWVLVPTKESAPFLASDPTVQRQVVTRLAQLNDLTERPIFSKRDVPGSEFKPDSVSIGAASTLPPTLL